ncbi:MAG TPA: hypothetical protein VK590_01485 [Saprospiraceae bacterium]|nr:hypothetical protein [Saprospiraceae bacterium]
MDKLSTQLWVGNEEQFPLEVERFKPVRNNGAFGIKGTGGLWTSTWLGEDKGSDWIQWSIGEGWGCPEDNKWKGYILEPKDDVNILVIDTLKDMHILFDTYGQKQFPEIPELDREALDFESMAQDYDGMRLTSHGQIVTRHGFSWFGENYFNEDLKEEWKEKKMRNLYGWDCESCFHFRWNFKTVTPIELVIKEIA